MLEGLRPDMVGVDAAELSSSLRRLIATSAVADLPTSWQLLVNSAGRLFGMSSCAITLTDMAGVPQCSVMTTAAYLAWTDAQSAREAGPDRDACRLDRLVVVDSIRTDDRWPPLTDRFAQVLADGAAMAAPVHLGTVPVGTIGVLLECPHHWAPSSRSAMLYFALVASRMLAVASQANLLGDMRARVLSAARSTRA